MATWVVVDWPGFFVVALPDDARPARAAWRRSSGSVGDDRVRVRADRVVCRSAVAPHAGRGRVGRARGGRDDPGRPRPARPGAPRRCRRSVVVHRRRARRTRDPRGRLAPEPLPGRWLSMPVLALVVVFAANPLQRGLGDLRGRRPPPSTVERGERRGCGDGEYLAADSLERRRPSDEQRRPRALRPAMARAGRGGVARPRPVRPQHGSPGIRGASYVVFDWAARRRRRTSGRFAEDIVQVRTDPCDEAVRVLGLRVAAASRPLDGDVPRGDRSASAGVTTEQRRLRRSGAGRPVDARILREP